MHYMVRVNLLIEGKTNSIISIEQVWQATLKTTKHAVLCCQLSTWQGAKKIWKIIFLREKFTREGNTFLFRPPVLVIQVERVECVTEEKALIEFMDFLKNVQPPIVLVGLDEETVGVLLQKLLTSDSIKLKSLVHGFTSWRRILGNCKTKYK